MSSTVISIGPVEPVTRTSTVAGPTRMVSTGVSESGFPTGKASSMVSGMVWSMSIPGMVKAMRTAGNQF